ncbi:MAG: c-type cytochrome domain-containing protein [Bacteroidales bacterium]|nr:c-type cytochrome domain-containing protein [Bacteroidales bacterium]
MRKLSFIILGMITVLAMTYTGCKHEPEEYIPDPDPDPDTTSCDTANVTYPGKIYPILDQYCISCHSGAGPSGGLDFTDYSQLAFVAENGALIGAIKHLSGYSPMPQGGEQLDSCKIRLIEIWIRDTTFLPPPDTTHPCNPDTVYFEMDVLPILMSSCGKSGCHDATAQDGVRLDSYTAVMGSDVITPGNPNDSELYEKITETDPEDIMPPPPDSPLDPAQMEIIRKWIAQGAQNLYCDAACDTVNVTFSGTIWPEIIQKHCFGCHNGPNASGGIHLENYNDVSAAANILPGQPGSLMGAITHAAGNSPMPQNQPQLPDCKISQVRNWISLGKPN